MVLMPVITFVYARKILSWHHPADLATRQALVLTVPLLAAIYLTYYLNVAVHEGGHWLAGRLVGFQTQAVQIGPLLWRRGTSGERFELAPWRGRIGGYVGMWPEDQQRLRGRFAAFVAGGPLGSLLIALATYPWVRTLAEPIGGSPGVLLYQAFVFFLFVYAAFMTVMNLVPFQSHGATTDGAKLLTVLRGGPKYKRLMAMITVGALGRSGARPRDYPPHLVEALTSAPDQSPEHAYMLLLRALHSFDTGHDEEAVQYASEAADTVKPKASILYSSILNEAAGIIAWFGAGATRARELFDKVDAKLLTFRFTRLRSEAAVLMAEGRLDDARRTLAAAKAQFELDAAMYRGLFAFERDWLDAMDRRLNPQ